MTYMYVNIAQRERVKCSLCNETMTIGVSSPTFVANELFDAPFSFKRDGFFHYFRYNQFHPNMWSL